MRRECEVRIMPARVEGLTCCCSGGRRGRTCCRCTSEYWIAGRLRSDSPTGTCSASWRPLCAHWMAASRLTIVCTHRLSARRVEQTKACTHCLFSARSCGPGPGRGARTCAPTPTAGSRRYEVRCLISASCESVVERTHPTGSDSPGSAARSVARDAHFWCWPRSVRASQTGGTRRNVRVRTE